MQRRSDRRTMLKALAGGAVVLGAAGASVGWLRRTHPRPPGPRPSSGPRDPATVAEHLGWDDVPVKNPAFSKSQTRTGPVLVTHTRDGRAIVLRLETESEFVWDTVLNVREYHEGKRLSVEMLLQTVARHYADRSPDQIRRECLDFLKAALRQNVLFTRASYVVSTVRSVSQHKPNDAAL